MSNAKLSPLNEPAWNSIVLDEKPFRHCHAHNILNDDVFRDFEKQIDELPPEKFGQHGSGYLFATFPDLEFMRFLYSLNFLKLMGTIFGRPVRPSKAYPVPQAYIFPRGGQGLPPHTDAADKRDVAMILYMNSDWQPQFGGELNLLTRREEGSFETERSIAPAPNTMVCLELSKHSWHSVTATDPKYQRKTIIADFDYVKG